MQASAPGKIILFGEHAVVYGQPAIAVPVTQVQVTARVEHDDQAPPGGRIIAPGIGLSAALQDLEPDHWATAVINQFLTYLEVDTIPPFTLYIESTIPVAAGLGSGAAVSAASFRAMSAFLGRTLSEEAINLLTYEVEKIHHGTPSGIDNTVITYAQPVYFVRGWPLEKLKVPVPFTIVIGDTGVRSPTAAAVGDVRSAWEADPERFDALFEKTGRIAKQARDAIENGHPDDLGGLMDENHALLREMTVSSPELDTLVETARNAGALGAKLSGGGRGGNMIALVRPENSTQVEDSLQSAGAVRTIVTEVSGEENEQPG